MDNIVVTRHLNQYELDTQVEAFIAQVQQFELAAPYAILYRDTPRITKGAFHLQGFMQERLKVQVPIASFIEELEISSFPRLLLEYTRRQSDTRTLLVLTSDYYLSGQPLEMLESLLKLKRTFEALPLPWDFGNGVLLNLQERRMSLYPQ